jgi:hypothetical protein
VAATAFALIGCDQGSQKDEPQGAGFPLVPVKLVASNIGPDQPLPANASIELAFDRLLSPLSITRQTFVLEDIGMTTGFTPTVSYDPVARIVTITPLTGVGQTLTPQQSYKLVITTPKNAADGVGLRAIDGAPLEAPGTRTIAFTAAAPTASPPATVSIDFCRDIHPIFQTNCAVATACHIEPSKSTPSNAAGLVLDPPNFIPTTAVGRVSQGANTGPFARAAAPSLLFGEDMPIIDPGGNASNSWLLYKILLAVPSPPPAPVVEAGAEAGEAAEAGDAGVEADSGAMDADTGEAGTSAEAGAPSEAGASDAGGADGGADAGDGGMAKAAPPPVVPPIDVSHAHALPWSADSATDRMVLSNYILGREMPYPPFAPLTLDELERLSLWIAQGAPTPNSCQ